MRLWSLCDGGSLSDRCLLFCDGVCGDAAGVLWVTVQGFQHLTEDLSGWGHFSWELLQLIRDEYGRTPVMLWALRPSQAEPASQEASPKTEGLLHIVGPPCWAPACDKAGLGAKELTWRWDPRHARCRGNNMRHVSCLLDNPTCASTGTGSAAGAAEQSGEPGASVGGGLFVHPACAAPGPARHQVGLLWLLCTDVCLTVQGDVHV